MHSFLLKGNEQLEEELASFRQQWHEELYDVDSDSIESKENQKEKRNEEKTNKIEEEVSSYKNILLKPTVCFSSFILGKTIGIIYKKFHQSIFVLVFGFY